MESEIAQNIHFRIQKIPFYMFTVGYYIYDFLFRSDFNLVIIVK